MFVFFDVDKVCIYNKIFKIILKNINIDNFKASARDFLNSEMFYANKKNVNKNNINTNSLTEIEIGSILDYDKIQYKVNDIQYDNNNFIDNFEITLENINNSSKIIIDFSQLFGIKSVVRSAPPPSTPPPPLPSTLKSLTNLLRNEDVYFKLKDSNFAIYENELYFFDDKFKINFGYEIYNSTDEKLIENTLIDELSKKIKNFNTNKQFNTTYNFTDFKKLKLINKESNIKYDNNPKDKVKKIIYDFDNDELYLELEKAIMNYKEKKRSLEIIEKFNEGNIVTVGNKKYKIDSVSGLIATMTNGKTFFLKHLKKNNSNNRKTKNIKLKKVYNDPITRGVKGKLENLGVLSNGKAPISSGLLYGTSGLKEGSRVIYKKAEKNKLYYLIGFIGNDNFKIESRNIEGMPIEEDIIAKKNEIESSNRINKDDIVVLNRINFNKENKYLTVKSSNDFTANVFNINNKESLILKNKLFKIKDSKFTKENVAIKKPILYGSTDIKTDSRVFFKKGEEDKKYYIKREINPKLFQLKSKNKDNTLDHNIYANISNIENIHSIKKGNIVAKSNDFFNKSKHYTVKNVNKNSANVINKSKKEKKYLLKDLEKVSSSKNQKSSILNKARSVFGFKKNLKKNDKLIYNQKTYTIQEVIKKKGSLLTRGEPSQYVLVNRRGQTVTVDAKNLSKPNVSSSFVGSF
jgi:hypothetical protein